jgi:hypothetical protein
MKPVLLDRLVAGLPSAWSLISSVTLVLRDAWAADLRPRKGLRPNVALLHYGIQWTINT